MSLLWVNLVTAVATLSAALGATYIKGLFDSGAEQRRLMHERETRRADLRAEAYSDFLKFAHMDARLLGQTIVQLSKNKRDVTRLQEIISTNSKIIDDFNSSRARVEIVGSAAAADSAATVNATARILGIRCNQSYVEGDHFDAAAAEDELGKLTGAIDTFAAVCRTDLNKDTSAEILRIE
jgi:hypothetical protein